MSLFCFRDRSTWCELLPRVSTTLLFVSPESSLLQHSPTHLSCTCQQFSPFKSHIAPSWVTRQQSWVTWVTWPVLDSFLSQKNLVFVISTRNQLFSSAQLEVFGRRLKESVSCPHKQYRFAKRLAFYHQISVDKENVHIYSSSQIAALVPSASYVRG